MDTFITATMTMGEWAAATVTVVLLLLCAAPFVWLCWRFVAIDDQAVAHAIEDVQRFVELTDQARQELAAAPRLPLLDPVAAAAATEAINRFITCKELARQALSPRPLSSLHEPRRSPSLTQDQSLTKTASSRTSWL